MVAIETLEAAAGEPISLAELRAWTRIDETREDATLYAQLMAARSQLEAMTGRVLMPCRLRIRLPGFPANGARLVLPRRPVRAVQAITYLDAAGVRQTLAADDYRAELFANSPYVVPAAGKGWPAALDEPGSVFVEIAAGYASASDIDPRFLRAVALLAGDYFDERRDLSSPDSLPPAVAALVRGDLLGFG